MLHGLKVIVVMPAYNATRTLERTYDDLPHEIVDTVILTDDCSTDETVALAQKMRPASCFDCSLLWLT